MRRLFEFLGGKHTDMARVTTADLLNYRRHLIETHKLGLPNPRDQIIEVTALFDVAARNGLLPGGDPAVSVKNPEKQSNPKNERQMFTREDRASLLIKSQGFLPVVRITTLIAAHTGSHTSEIVEAHTDDIEVMPDGTAVFHIREDNRETNQILKTVARKRSLPLHSRIRDEVLAHKAAILAQYGPGPLFPMVKLDKYGRRNTYASNAIMAWLRSPDGAAITDPRKDFYSWRKTIRTLLLNTKVDPDRARYIVGHAAKDIDAKHYRSMNGSNWSRPSN